MLSIIFGFIGSIINPIANIAAKIADEKIALAQASTDKAKIASEERIAGLEQRRAVMIAEAGGPYGWINAMIRGFLALGPCVFLTKVFIWDKVLQSVTHGSTDALDPNLWGVVMVVVGFYFLDSIAARFKR